MQGWIAPNRKKGELKRSGSKNANISNVDFEKFLAVEIDVKNIFS